MTPYHRIKGIKRDRVWFVVAGVAAVALMAIAAFSYYFYSRGALPESKAQSLSSSMPRDEKISAALFFSSVNEDFLVSENRLIPKKEALGPQVKEVLKELIAGSSAGHLPVLSAKTRVREVFVDSNGTAYIDFSRDLSADFPGGSWNELAAVYSVVNTLASNFPEIKRVQFMVEGARISTLAGHIDTAAPVTPRMGLARADGAK